MSKSQNHKCKETVLVVSLQCFHSLLQMTIFLITRFQPTASNNIASLVTCVIKTLLHERFIKTVSEFLLLLVCIVFPELSCVLLRYVSCTNKE